MAAADCGGHVAGPRRLPGAARLHGEDYEPGRFVERSEYDLDLLQSLQVLPARQHPQHVHRDDWRRRRRIRLAGLYHRSRAVLLCARLSGRIRRRSGPVQRFSGQHCHALHNLPRRLGLRLADRPRRLPRSADICAFCRHEHVRARVHVLSIFERLLRARPRQAAKGPRDLRPRPRRRGAGPVSLRFGRVLLLRRRDVLPPGRRRIARAGYARGRSRV
mmetsp:Transcript_6047/g.19311  ORF Transcript_6047/g.19311 Transcript_6047/m.19311 type:complete len:218 (-) Transcript_6047:509-1162(-)